MPVLERRPFGADGVPAVVAVARRDLDLAAEPAARAELQWLVDRHPGRLLVDCSGVFVGACGLRLLADAAQRSGGRLAVVGTRHLRSVVRLTGLPLVMHGSVAEALATGPEEEDAG